MYRGIVAERPATIDDIRRMAVVSLWMPAVVDETICVLVHEGAIEEGATGRIIVHPWPIRQPEAA
jgi:hypothetical protein